MRAVENVRTTARRSLTLSIVLLAMTGLGALDVPREARASIFVAILAAALGLLALGSDTTPPPSGAAVAFRR